MFRLAVYLKEYRKECILGPLFKFLEVILELLLPTVLAVMINRGVARHDVGFVLRTGALMVLMSLMGYGSAMVCQRFAARASQGFGTTLRNVTFHKILSFSFPQMEAFGASTLTNRLTNDINQLQQFVALMIRLMVRAPFICIGAIVMSFFLDSRTALLLLLATPLLAAVIFGATRSAAPLYRLYQRLLDRIAAVLGESLSGVRVIRSFGRARAQKGRFDRANGELVRTGLRIGNISSLLNPLTALVVNLVTVALLWVGGIRIDAGRLSQGQVIAFINYATQILYALLVISNLIILLTKSMASAARLEEVLDVPAAAVPAQAISAADPLPAVFRDVSFGYSRGGERALRHLSFRMERGETVGLIGGTGSGKSTVVRLLAGLYPPDSGEVRLGGAAPSRAVCARVAVVPQKAVLFTGTVADNIRFGRPDAPMAEVERAARIAQAAEFIEKLPRGYGTMVERGGRNLSGGQRQRLTIARALLLRPALLVLDDASSALDYLTEAKLRRAIREDAREMAVLVISQRVGAIRDADRILVLEDGSLAGSGTHSGLLESCPVYREICRSQMTEEEAPA